MGRVAKAAFVWLACLAGALGLFAAGPAAAETGAPQCQASSDRTVTVSDLQASDSGWQCSGPIHKSEAAVSWLRFDLAAARGGAEPRYFAMQLSRFSSITLTILRDGREIAYGSYERNAIRQGRNGPYFVLDLPEHEGLGDTLVVRIEGGRSGHATETARITTDRQEAGWSITMILLLAAIFGMVCAPMLFNVALFAIVRSPFLLYHTGMATGMLMVLAVNTGLLSGMFDIATAALMAIRELGFTVIVCFGGFFAATFLEESAISPATRKALAAAGLFLLVVAGSVVLQVPPIDRLGYPAYYLAFFPMLFVSLFAMVEALLRKSVWVRYQIAGWVPAIITGLDLVAYGLGVQDTTVLGAAAPAVAMSIEVGATATGVAHRLLLMRRQRDIARSEAALLEQLSEHDPMTGLVNRRGLAGQFTNLHRSGHETFALLDLDYFKQVNDTAGHTVGDAVIRCAADVLKSDPDSIAIRLGGEEFMLIMRGADAPERAEALRQAIPLRIAREVDGLDRIVTASMGLCVIPVRAVPHSSFEDIYAMVDKLLYDAKKAGRNQTTKQTLRAFRQRGQDRRIRAA